MERTRLVWLVALAFLGGLLLAAAALSDEGGAGLLGPRRADALVVRILNEGNAAHVEVGMRPVDRPIGGTVNKWSWTLGSGGSEVARYPDPPGQMIVEVSAAWSGATGQHDGEARFTPDPGECAGQTARLDIELDTSRGVVFRRASALACE